MIYVQLTLEVPRGKVQEALRSFQTKGLNTEKKNLESVGAKLVGCWYTKFGRVGEITMLFAYPSLEAREKVVKAASRDAEFKKWSEEEWYEYTRFGDMKVLVPANFSPLQ